MDRMTAGVLWMGGAMVVGAVGLAAVYPWSAPAPDPTPLPEIVEGAVLSVNPAVVRAIDHELVHEQLIPDWVRATGGLKALHWERLQREVASDPNLSALLDRMGHLIDQGPAQHLDELEVVVRTWNDVMASAEVPYRLADEFTARGWFLKAYRNVLMDASVTVDGGTYGVTVRRRVDEAGPVDAWLGQIHAHQERVVILLDRVTSFTLDRIWPLLDPVLDTETDPLASRFAQAVRSEVAAALPPESVNALVDTAADRFWLLRATESVHRRASCGSEYRIVGLPWNGVSTREQANLRNRAIETGENPCPDVTEQEALVFAVRSMHVRQIPGVRDALEQLVAFVATAVVTHEARHAADFAQRAQGTPLVCRGCPEELPALGVWEGSAYLSTFAVPDFASIALFQACAIDPVRQPDRAAAVRFLAEELVDGGCRRPPPSDLAHRAQTLEAILFDRAGSVSLEAFPKGLPVSSTYGSR
ncbi:MAG: hypothetical protein AAGA48_04970 [Myxococcota bacterium]